MIAKPEPDVERAAEAALLAAGLRGARVFAHGDVARVEVSASELARLARPGVRETAIAAVQALGFRFVTIDLGTLDGR